MNIIAVDDEKIALDVLEKAIRKAEPDAEVHAFLLASDALAYAEENPCDTAFLDIEIRDMNGLELAKRLKELNPKANIVFVTGYSQYMGDALSMYVSGYVMKPLDDARVRRELDNLRFPVGKPGARRIRVQCFGNFEIFADGKPIAFSRKKSKELLAYLVDRQGAGVSIPEAAGILFEDCRYSRSRQRQMQYVITDALQSLKAAGAEDVMIRQRSMLSVDPSKFDCDLNAFLSGDAAAVHAYRGEYMVQYSWAEFSFRS